MPNLQELQRPIDEAMARALVEVIPESWEAAELEITRSEQGDQEPTFKHVISSPEGHRDMIMPSDDIFEAAFKLGDLFAEHGKPWKRVVYRVNYRPNGKWKYSADFTY